MTLTAPFPWFGGKSRVVPLVWDAIGADVGNYVEPFFGSGAVLLGRPGWTPDAGWIETINDKDGYVANFWRAVSADPEQVTHWADWPVNENDLSARHAWLVARKASLVERLEGDPDYYDAQIAGWWVWGICCWIGSNWCLGVGPWHVEHDADGVAVLVKSGDAGMGVYRQLVHLGSAGMGVHRKLVHLGNAGMGDAGNGTCGLLAWMVALSERLRRVRVCCGDWTRVMGSSPTVHLGVTGVFLDPPYSAEAGRNENIYTVEDTSIAHDVRAWCLEHGADPRLRIVLCGYEGEHEALADAGWTSIGWKAHGGYGSQGNGRGRDNANREVLWLSPHCLRAEPHTQMGLVIQAEGE